MIRLTSTLPVAAIVPLVLAVLSVSIVNAQTPVLYGPPISLEDAKKAAAAALTEARKTDG